MKYREYSAEEFAVDGFFVRWVRRPDQESEWFWRSFIMENPECETEIEKARQIVLAMDFQLHQLKEDAVDRMRNSLLLVLHAEKEERKEKLSRRSPYLRRSVWLKIAATVMIIPFLFFGSDLLIGHISDDTPTVSQENDEALEVRSNPSGQKSVLFLSDGTKVWLNAASKISYVRGFQGEGTRDVYLEGEAFFDVVRDERKPFVVHTSSIRIKVLGTAFNVKSYSQESTVETTLLHGRVLIGQPSEQGDVQEEIELMPNQRAVFHKESKVLKVKDVIASSSGVWRQDRLVFDGETIDNVLLQLERWYDVTIVAEGRGSLKCKLTASIEKESLEQVLRLIETTLGVQFTIEGRKVVLEGPLCSQQ